MGNNVTFIENPPVADAIEPPYLYGASLKMQSSLMSWAKQHADEAGLDTTYEPDRNAQEAIASAGSGFDTYKSTFKGIPVLDRSEELDIFQRIGHAKLATARMVIDGLCAANGMPGVYEPEDKDMSIIQDGLAAKNKLLYHNLRLVSWLSVRYRPNKSSTIEPEDLISEGIFGLEKAIDKFDTSTGNAFSTYAVQWVRSSMSRAVQSNSMIPEHLQDKVKPLKVLLRSGKADEEIIEALGITAGTYASLVPHVRPPLSLDAPLSDDSATSLGDTITTSADTHSPSGVEVADMREVLRSIMDDVLNDQQKRVIGQRFGLGADEGMTLQEIGDKEGCTRERIRQIEQRALRLLRKRAEKQGFSWLDNFA